MVATACTETSNVPLAGYVNSVVGSVVFIVDGGVVPNVQVNLSMVVVAFTSYLHGTFGAHGTVRGNVHPREQEGLGPESTDAVRAMLVGGAVADVHALLPALREHVTGR